MDCGIDTLTQIKQQHVKNYKNAILELIKNNTNVLFDEDIKMLIAKPPLDSMDIIKTKFLELAKKNNIVLNTDSLTESIDKYRIDLLDFSNGIKEDRIKYLSDIVNKQDLSDENSLIKLNKKDFLIINKKIKKEIKDKLNIYIEKNIVNNVNMIFTSDIDDLTSNKFITELKKYFTGKYVKQMLENIDFKILVKDTTLINLIKEQGERYIFTKKNSYIFKEQ